MNKLILLYTVLLFGLVSCHDSRTDDIEKKINITNNKAATANTNALSKLDSLFIGGFNLELSQIYIMGGTNTIPILDQPTDSLFKTGKEVINLSQFYAYVDSANYNLMSGVIKGETWQFSKMITKYDTTYWENGYGSTYHMYSAIGETTYNYITCNNNYTSRLFAVKIIIGDLYCERGHDNHSFCLYYVNSIGGSAYSSNLRMEILTNNGCGLFNNKFMYLDTNMDFSSVTYQISSPLTSDQVKKQVLAGNYKLYLYKGLVTYNINNNLYVVRYNSYVYVGTTNTIGTISESNGKYYRFKFKIK